MIKAHTNSQRWEQHTGPAQVYTRSFIYIQPPVEASLSVRMSRSLYLALSLERFPSVCFVLFQYVGFHYYYYSLFYLLVVVVVISLRSLFSK